MKQRAARGRATTAAAAACTLAASALAQPNVVDGYKVDAGLYSGYSVWRSLNCGGCHGPEQQGLNGPALIDTLKTMPKDQFVRAVREGSPGKMPAFGQVPRVMDNIDHLYAYLKGRADGTITRARVELLQ